MSVRGARGSVVALGLDPSVTGHESSGQDLRIPRPRGAERRVVSVSGRTTQAITQARPSPSYVAETPLSAPTAVVATPPAVRRLLHRPRLLFAGQVLIVIAVGILVAGAVGADPRAAAAVLLSSLVLKYHAGRSIIRPGLPHLGRIASDLALPYAAVAAGVTYDQLPGSALRDMVAIVVAVNVVDVAATLMRRRLEKPIRIIIVGDRNAIAKAATRCAGHVHAKIVGALLLTPDMEDQQPVGETFGVRTIRGIGEVVDWVERWDADMVVVTPGPGVTSTELRTLSWGLEHTDASLAVTGILDSVAPHRIDSTTLGGATLIQARSSRPSTYIRAVKWTVDRIVGTLLLAVAAPVIAVACLFIRLESRGPGLFKQVRVGRDGRTFTMYKLRTMHAEAETARVVLAGNDDGNGVLFKLHSDPRITGIGRIMRKSSLDELPQLINVVLGQMSLVGPRPALPCEVEKYDDLACRRMVVRPGMTGLWQVSGRSDLGWSESVELDLRYTDNYRLCNDLLIGLRTVGAVARSKGAY